MQSTNREEGKEYLVAPPDSRSFFVLREKYVTGSTTERMNYFGLNAFGGWRLLHLSNALSASTLVCEYEKKKKEKKNKAKKKLMKQKIERNERNSRRYWRRYLSKCTSGIARIALRHRVTSISKFDREFSEASLVSVVCIGEKGQKGKRTRR